jgi:hypothetical protein
MCGWGIVLISILNLLDIRKCPVDTESNTEANASNCELCNIH